MSKVHKLIPCLAALLAFFACKNDPKTAETSNNPQNLPKEIKVEALPVVSAANAKDWKVTGGTLFWAGNKPATE